MDEGVNARGGGIDLLFHNIRPAIYTGSGPSLRATGIEEAAMKMRNRGIDRRTMLGAGGAALLAAGAVARADEKAAPAAAEAGKKLSELIAEFVTGFDLKAVPPLAVERARLAFTDTLGVML